MVFIDSFYKLLIFIVPLRMRVTVHEAQFDLVYSREGSAPPLLWRKQWTSQTKFLLTISL